MCAKHTQVLRFGHSFLLVAPALSDDSAVSGASARVAKDPFELVTCHRIVAGSCRDVGLWNSLAFRDTLLRSHTESTSEQRPRAHSPRSVVLFKNAPPTIQMISAIEMETDNTTRTPPIRNLDYVRTRLGHNMCVRIKRAPMHKGDPFPNLWDHFWGRQSFPRA